MYYILCWAKHGYKKHLLWNPKTAEAIKQRTSNYMLRDKTVCGLGASHLALTLEPDDICEDCREKVRGSLDGILFGVSIIDGFGNCYQI